MTTPMIAITVYWRLRYAAAPSWIAAAISRIRSLPVGLARTRKIRTMAKATAASPPATPNHAVLGSIYLLVSRKRRKMPRLERLVEPEIHHRSPSGSPGELERVEAPGCVRPARLDAVDAGQPRTLLEGAFQLFELLTAAFGDQLHGPVVVVA